MQPEEGPAWCKCQSGTTVSFIHNRVSFGIIYQVLWTGFRSFESIICGTKFTRKNRLNVHKNSNRAPCSLIRSSAVRLYVWILQNLLSWKEILSRLRGCNTLLMCAPWQSLITPGSYTTEAFQKKRRLTWTFRRWQRLLSIGSQEICIISKKLDNVIQL